MPFVALGAIAAGVATTAFAVSATTMAMVGIGATVVGKLTKSKELMQLGGGLSLGAGISSLGQSLFGAAEAGSTALSAADGAGYATKFGEVSAAAESALGTEAAAGYATKFGDASSMFGSSSGATAGLPNTSTTGLINSTASKFPNFNTNVAEFGQAGEQAKMAGDVAKAVGNTAIAAPGGTDPGTIASWWSKLPESTKNTVLQMGGNMASKLFEGWSQEEMMAFQREKFKLEQDRYNQSIANANAQPTIVRPAGLLNATRG